MTGTSKRAPSYSAALSRARDKRRTLCRRRSSIARTRGGLALLFSLPSQLGLFFSLPCPPTSCKFLHWWHPWVVWACLDWDLIARIFLANCELVRFEFANRGQLAFLWRCPGELLTRRLGIRTTNCASESLWPRKSALVWHQFTSASYPMCV